MKNIFRNLIVLAAALALPLSLSADEDSGIVLSKKVADKGDGRYTLTLETYTTGTTVTTKTIAPTDFVLLLDWSSSMDEEISVTTDEKRVSGSLNANTTYIYYANATHSTKYYLKRIKKGAKYKWAISTSTTFPNFDNIPSSNVLATTEKLNTSELETGEVYTETATTKNRTLALQEAVSSFLDSVEEQNPDGGYHRVAIVWYAKGTSTSKTLKDYEFHDLTATLKSSLQSSIKGTGNANNDITSLTRTGTHSDEAFAQAEEIIALSNPDGRDRVVVFFTDGEPGDMTGRFEDSRARPCLKSARVIKATQTSKDGVTPVKYAKVYSVGLMTSGTADTHYNQGTTGQLTNNTNDKYRFMHYVSSNFDLSNVTDATINSYRFNEDLSGAVNVNTEAGSGAASPWGFFKQSDGSDLEAIFEEIASENANTNTDINAESAVVLDALTNMFKLPAGTKTSDIKLYTCAAKTSEITLVWADSGTGKVVWKDAENNVLPDNTTPYDHKELWVAWEPWNDSTIKTERKDGKLVYDFNGDGTVEITDFIWINSGKVGMADGETDFLEVMGFDYPGNFVGPKIDENEKVTGYQGKKLIIQFDIETDEANTGGINLQTNDECSGVYCKDKTGKYSPVENYECPFVYLPYLKIIKKGLNIGESAIFTITKVIADKSETATTTDSFSAEVVLVKTGETDPSAVVKLRHAGWYKVTESSWSWTSTPEAVSQWGELKTAKAATGETQQEYLEYTFTNTPDSNLTGISAEAAVINNMTTGTHITTETVD